MPASKASATRKPATYEGGPLDGQTADHPLPRWVRLGATLSIRLDENGRSVEPGDKATEEHIYKLHRGPVWRHVRRVPR